MPHLSVCVPLSSSARLNLSVTCTRLTMADLQCCSLSGIMVEQFVPDGPHAHLYSNEHSEWVKLMNWQHSTMYLFFGIYGIVLVASTATKLVPVGFNRLALSIALFVEGKAAEKQDFLLKKLSFTSQMRLFGNFLPCSSRLPVLLPRPHADPSGLSHPLVAAGGCVWWIGQHHVGGVHKRQHHCGALRRVYVHSSRLMVLPGKCQMSKLC